ncbi:Hsp70 protein [seawater metagenome]|uniref:Hsp70 protein n=1 Tax=seawater metagenome TaxID=1561972 RepID=A0A5E8CJ71_9ZZZZ
MSVVGIDFGNKFFKIAGLRNGSVETLLFNQSNRKSPGIISFLNKRYVGLDAQNFVRNNLDSSVGNLKQLIYSINNDLKFENIFKDYQKENLLNIDDQEYSIYQIFSTVIKKLLDASIGRTPNDLVISIPSFFTIYEHDIIYQALEIINVTNPMIISEEVAVSLNYGYYKALLKEFENPETVLFINIGSTSTQAFITEFSNDKLKIVRSSGSITIGGDHFDKRIFDMINKKIYQKYNININMNSKYAYTLLKECEKAKQVLSSNLEANLVFDYTPEDILIQEKITLKEFNQLTDSLSIEILSVINSCIENYDLDKLTKVELIGGSMRIPKIKDGIKERLKMEPRYSLNADECVAKGSVLYGALNSCSVKIKDYALENVINSNITLKIGEKIIKITEDNLELPSTKLVKCKINTKLVKPQIEILMNNNLYSIYELEIDELNDSKIEIKLKIDVNRIIRIEKIKIEIEKEIKELKEISFIRLGELDQNLKNLIIENEAKIVEKERLLDECDDLKNSIEEKFYLLSELIVTDPSFQTYLSPDELAKLEVQLLKAEELFSEDTNVDSIIEYRETLESFKYVFSEINFRKITYQKVPIQLDIMEKETGKLEEKIKGLQNEQEIREKMTELEDWLKKKKEIMKDINLFESPPFSETNLKNEYTKLYKNVESLIPQITGNAENL